MGMFGRYFPRRIPWRTPIENIAAHELSHESARAYVLKAIDCNGFDWRVVAVAGSALFTTSYNLFAINFILPVLQYLYYSNNGSLYLPVNLSTLAGLVVGQLLFGFLADKYGRRRLYGLELVIVIVSAVGTAQASDGRDNSMSLVSWLLFWRFTMGIGIGAGYPLSAVITAEFAPVRTRPRMMATVFLMEPLGQLASALVSLLVATGLNSQYNGFPDKAVDQIWRAVLGVGAFPALIALLLRYTMPESPRYTFDVDNFPSHDVPIRQVTEMESNFRYSVSGVGGSLSPVDITDHRALSQVVTETDYHGSVNLDQSVNEAPNEIEYFPRQFSMRELKQYFLVEGNWRYLLATSLCWFSLDFALWGLGTNNPETLAWLWNQSSSAYVPLFSQIGDYAKREMILVSIGAVFGSLVLLRVINIASRKQALIWSFLSLAGLFVVTGSFILGAVSPGTSSSATVIVLYVLCQIIFNLGPNTLIYIISAEIFPTRYRATCYGISAAAGTIGSIIVEVSLFPSSSTGVQPNLDRLGWLLVGCSPLLTLAAVLAWAWIPALQSPRLESEISERPQDTSLILVSKTLEQLGLGIRGARIDGDVIGISKRFRWILVRLRIMKA